MWFKACTHADIAFLNTLVSNKAKGRSHVSQKEFRNVSIITALNSQKDEINHLGSLRYAAETSQDLHHFLSQDTIPSNDDGKQPRKKNRQEACSTLHKNIKQLTGCPVGSGTTQKLKTNPCQAFIMHRHANHDLT